ncbi:MAG: GNAT family N-acetyltransferase [Nanoarchaeota archaeon]
MENIIIRKAKVKDEKGIADFIKEAFRRKNWIYTGSNKPLSNKSIKKAEKELKSKSPDSYCFIAIDKKTEKIIGSTIISFKKKGRVRHKINLGWGLHPDYQGKGIGTLLVKEILKFAKKKGFKIAIVEAAVENIASVKLAKKCGFRIVGKIKKGLLTDDKRYIDTVILWREL